MQSRHRRSRCSRKYLQTNCTGRLYICDLDVVTHRRSFAREETASILAAEMRAAFRRLKQKLREHGGPSDLSPSQTAVILRLEKDGPATVSSLARAEGMRPQSMSALVAQLQALDLVRGAADPNDGRQTLMSLTPKCLRSLEEGRAARQDWLSARISEKLSALEQKKLQSALALLARLVEE